MSFCLLLLSFCHMIKNQLPPRASIIIRVCVCMCAHSASSYGARVLGRYRRCMVSGTMGIVSALYGSVCGSYDVQCLRHRVAAGYFRYDRHRLRTISAPAPGSRTAGRTRGVYRTRPPPLFNPFCTFKNKKRRKKTVCLLLTYRFRHIMEKIAAKK